jgi:hypothetical protein
MIKHKKLFTEFGVAFRFLTNSGLAVAGEKRWAWPWQMSAPNRLPAAKNFGWAAYSRLQISQ